MNIFLPRHLDDKMASQAADPTSRVNVSQHQKMGEVGELCVTDDGSKAHKTSLPAPTSTEEDDSDLSVPCVFFRCPFGCSAIYPKAIIDKHMLGHLHRMLRYRPLEASVLMIHSLSKNQDKLHAGLQILCKYLDNVCNNPSEERYRKISEHNKAFQERVAPLEGAKEFMQAVGFLPKQLPVYQDTEMPFLVMSAECASDTDQIKSARDVLLNTQPSRAVLHRDVRVYHPSQKADDFRLPTDFYDTVPGSNVSNSQTPASRHYLYTVIRISFPDGVLLQGTFHVRERFSAVKAFVSSTLEREWQPFVLRNKSGAAVTEINSTLVQLQLVPGAVLYFGFNATIEAEMATGLYFCIHGPVKQEHHIKAAIMRAISVL